MACKWRKTPFNPTTIHKLQKATRLGDYVVFQEYSNAINDQSRDYTLGGLMSLCDPSDSRLLMRLNQRVKRKAFQHRAMSYGSISKEAHESLAIAMNRLGGKSNTGEGGEDIDRFTPDANGDSRRSATSRWRAVVLESPVSIL